MVESNSSEVLVLLVEDNPADVLLMQEAVEECSIKVSLIVAENGEEALDILQQPDFKPDLIILDLHLPRLDGLDVLERYEPKMVPVIIFSSNCSDPEAERAMRLGASDCVTKPAELNDFLETVCAMVERWTAPSIV